MLRRKELKRLLKTWETDFQKQKHRKPSQVDIANAPEETQALYKEYRSLKRGSDGNTGAAEQTLDDAAPQTSTPCFERHQVFPASDSWGDHLNRTCLTQKRTPKMTSGEHDSLKASAQYFGMKLKANLGSLKERPVSLRKSFPRCAQPSLDQLESGEKKPSESSLPDFISTSARNLPGPVADSGNDPILLTQRASRGDPHMQSARKPHHLQNMVGQRLASLNQDWLERCGGTRTAEEQAVITGALAANNEKRSYTLTGRLSNRSNLTPVTVSDLREEQTIGTSAGPPASQTETSHILTSESKNADGVEVTCETLSSDRSPDILHHDNKSASGGRLSETGSSNTNAKLGQSIVRSGSDSSEREGRCSRTSSAIIPVAGDVSQEEYSSETKKANDLNPSKRLVTPDAPKEGNEKHQLLLNVETSVKGCRKRKQKVPCDPDPEQPSPENCKKKMRKKSGSQTSGKIPAKATKSPDDENPPKTDMSENLLGEMMEENNTRNVVPSARNFRRPSQKNVGNFVRINLKKKSHVKAYALNGNRLRKQVWKQKWQKKGQQFGGGQHFNHPEDTCFRCGKVGHWSSQCPGTAPVPAPLEADSEEADIVLPTLEDVARRTNTQYSPNVAPAQDPSVEIVTPLDVVRPLHEPPVPPASMQPLYSLSTDGKVQKTPPEVYEALHELGFHTFRPGQEDVVMRILSGLSSLLILSTGMGKSLCYQLPAYMFAKRSQCITLVISPLVSLMDDQVSGLPGKLKAVCIHSNMTRSQREAAIQKVKEGRVHVLLLSPEALVGGGRTGSSCLPPAEQLPPVAFACIDEAHCVSEWSHNFRPCYLRLCKVLHERLGVRCLLGLTATATMATAHDVAHHLGVSEDGGIPVRIAAVPPNLHLSVSMDRDRDQALVALLKGERFGCLDSIIVYCTRREETTRISALLRTCLQGVTLSKSQDVEAEGDPDSVSSRKKAQARKKIRRPLKWLADSYHAGLSAAERRRVQNNFMSGQLRLVVATVAFGMGLDKSDVRGIIHYNMPKNFESYVQEIGRAGRDGKDAHCHLFLDPEAQDLDELRRHIYADSMDYFTIKRLVQRVFPPCKCRALHRKQEALKLGGEVADSEMLDIMEHLEEQRAVTERVCHMHERALPIEETVQTLDVREEGIETLLCYLELHKHRWLELLHPTLSTCRVTCYSGPQHLRNVAKSCPPVAVALAVERLAGVDHTHVSSVEFNVVELADSMAWEVVPVKRALRELQWKHQTQGGVRGTGRSGVLAEFSKLSFHFRSYGDLIDQELEEICDFLYQKVTLRERTALLQLKSCYDAFRSVAYRASSACAEQVGVERSTQLKSLLLEYFEKRNPLNTVEGNCPDEEELKDMKDWKDQVCCDIRHFLSIHQDERFTGRAIARIFHGIGSPCYPAQVFGRDRRFWRKYIHLDFNHIMQLSKEEIIRLK